MRRKTGIVILAVLITAAVAGTSFGWGGKEGRDDPYHKGKMEAMKKELNLTADQEKALKAAKEASHADMENLRGQLKEKRQLLKDEVSKPGVTRKDVEPIVADMKKLESDMVEKRVDGIFKIKGILTPEQFSKLEAKKDAKGKSGKKGHCEKGW